MASPTHGKLSHTQGDSPAVKSHPAVGQVPLGDFEDGRGKMELFKSYQVSLRRYGGIRN